jgi:hypothetical protein
MADLAGLGGGTTGTTNRIEHAVKYAQQINKGQAVYVSSADGTNMIVSKADNSAEATSSKTIGLVTATGNTNFQGSVVTEGLLAGLDTSLATIGDAVWLGTNGNLIFWHYGLTTKPVAPDHLVFIGIVTRVNANNGEIFVKVQNGYELDEIHDVSLPAYIDKGVLYRDVATNLWKTDSIANLLGQANATTSGYLSELDWSLFNSKQPALSGGIANRTVVWDSASTLRNGAIIDTGTFVSINMATTNSAILEVDGGNGGTQGGIYGQGNLYGVRGYSYNGSGIYGTSSGGIGVRGESAGTLPSNIGVSGVAIALIIPGSPISLENIGGKFYAEGANANYAIQLVDGTEGIGKFLKSITSDGKANWSTISSSDVTTALGFTPANIAGASFTGNISALNLLGSNTGDETTSTIKTKLGAASAGQDGYLTSGNWTTFNSKQDALTYTPANKAGETFTGNISATNLSGTNTGDETTATIKTKLGAATSTLDGYLLATDWVMFNAKVATSVTISTTAPLQGGGDLSNNRTLSITQAGVTTDGFLSSTDWNTFSNKQNSINLTTTGTSGAATFDGSTLNIPQYTGSGASEKSGSILSTARSLPFKMATGITTYRSASGVGSTTVSSTTFTGESTHYYPISLKEGSPVRAAAFRVNSAGSGGLGTAEIEVGIYNSTTNANGELIPGTLEVQFGKVSILSTGVKEAVLASPYTLGATVDNIYWVAFRSYSTNSTSLNIYSSTDTLSSWIGMSSSTALVKLGMFIATTPYTAPTGLPASLPVTGGVGFTQTTTVAGYTVNQLLIGLR